MNEPITLWILLDVSNMMRGATIESARNVLQQYVLGPLTGYPAKISLTTFSNTAKLMTETPISIQDFELPSDFVIGGLCNLSDAIAQCRAKCSKDDMVIVLTKGLTTDSYGDMRVKVANESHIVILDSDSSHIPSEINSYFSGKIRVHNMQSSSLNELTTSIEEKLK